jgi:hypothetical protein
VIDRQDFLGLVNPRGDDGTTAYIAPPAVPTAKAYRSTTVSWIDFMDSASEIVHNGTYAFARTGLSLRLTHSPYVG